MFRKTYFVKPLLQVKYSLITIAIVAITLVCVYLAFNYVVIGSGKLSHLSIDEVTALKSALRMTFLWTFVIVGVAIGLESVFLFHHLVHIKYKHLLNHVN